MKAIKRSVLFVALITLIVTKNAIVFADSLVESVAPETTKTEIDARVVWQTNHQTFFPIASAINEFYLALYNYGSLPTVTINAGEDRELSRVLRRNNVFFMRFDLTMANLMCELNRDQKLCEFDRRPKFFASKRSDRVIENVKGQRLLAIAGIKWQEIQGKNLVIPDLSASVGFRTLGFTIPDSSLIKEAEETDAAAIYRAYARGCAAIDHSPQPGPLTVDVSNRQSVLRSLNDATVDRKCLGVILMDNAQRWAENLEIALSQQSSGRDLELDDASKIYGAIFLALRLYSDDTVNDNHVAEAWKLLGDLGVRFGSSLRSNSVDGLPPASGRIRLPVLVVTYNVPILEGSQGRDTSSQALYVRSQLEMAFGDQSVVSHVNAKTIEPSTHSQSKPHNSVNATGDIGLSADELMKIINLTPEARELALIKDHADLSSTAKRFLQDTDGIALVIADQGFESTAVDENCEFAGGSCGAHQLIAPSILADQLGMSTAEEFSEHMKGYHGWSVASVAFAHHGNGGIDGIAPGLKFDTIDVNWNFGKIDKVLVDGLLNVSKFYHRPVPIILNFSGDYKPSAQELRRYLQNTVHKRDENLIIVVSAGNILKSIHDEIVDELFDGRDDKPHSWSSKCNVHPSCWADDDGVSNYFLTVAGIDVASNGRIKLWRDPGTSGDLLDTGHATLIHHSFDIAAPAKAIRTLTAGPSGGAAYTVQSGTSFASPIVAAVTALMSQRSIKLLHRPPQYHSGLHFSDIKRRIISCGNQHPRIFGSVKGGVVDAECSIRFDQDLLIDTNGNKFFGEFIKVARGEGTDLDENDTVIAEDKILGIDKLRFTDTPRENVKIIGKRDHNILLAMGQVGDGNDRFHYALTDAGAWKWSNTRLHKINEEAFAEVENFKVLFKVPGQEDPKCVRFKDVKKLVVRPVIRDMHESERFRNSVKSGFDC